MRKGFVLVVALLAVSILLTACPGAQPTPETVVVRETVIIEGTPQVVEKEVTKVVEVEKEKEVEVVVTATPEPGLKTLVLNFGAGDVPTIDPSLATDTSSNQIIHLTFVGATRINEETTETEPGIATEWEVSEDGLTYTFHLRTDVPWVKYNAGTGQVEKVQDDEGNDRMVTCADFEYGILRTLDPRTAADYAYLPATFIAGAEDFNTADASALSDEEMQALADGVGVNCADEATLEMTINEPAAYFPGIAGLWFLSAQPQWVIEDKGDRWIEPGFYETYGPYTLKDWNHEVDITLVANPFWPGTDNIPQPTIPQVTWLMLDETPAFALYETGELDAVPVPLPELDRIKADPELSQQLKIAPVNCTYYYGFNVTKPPFDDANVRKAFSWAVDRTALVENVTKGGQEPARWFARPGLAAAPDPADGDDFGPPVTADAQKAQEFLAASSYGSAANLPPIELVMNQVEGHVRIGEALQQMWKENLGVDVQLTTQEWKVFLETLDQDPPQIWRLGWCMDYPDASNFTKDVFYSTSGNNHTKWANEEFDRIVDEAALETDMEKRHEMYVQAERILVEEDAAMMPLYWYTRVTLTQPYVERTFSVTGGQEAIYKWDVNK